MEKYTNEELLEVLPYNLRDSRELTTKQKVVLGQLIIYSGLNETKNNGYFYRSNKDLSNDCDIQEKTLITAINKLVSLGFIERKSGSRTEGASLYKLNKNLIENYSKNNIEDYSENYSKQIAEMSDRIKQLEVTVKTLVEKITVIEGKNYSTEVEIEKEIEKEVEIEKDNNNNILEINSLNKIEEKDNVQEVEKGGSEGNPTESQLVKEELLASAALYMDSTEKDSASVEQHKIATEDEQYQQFLQFLAPYLQEIDDAVTLGEMKEVREKICRYGTDYSESHTEICPTVLSKINEKVVSKFNEKIRYLKDRLAPDEEELSEYLKRQHNYGSL